jgi:HK97 family phage prohead protease
MPIEPGKDESQDDWMARCMHEMSQSPDRTNEQNVAICMDAWREAHKSAAGQNGDQPMRNQQRATPSPEPDEDHDTFIARCTAELEADGLDEDDADQVCEIAWEERGAKAPVVKTVAHPVRNFEFTLSDETEDRYGDIISADGWHLDNFRRNPSALFGHDHGFPIGKWLDVHVDPKTRSLRGRLDIIKGASARIDEIRALVDGGYLNAVSVGFRAIKTEPLKDKDGKETGGLRFLKQDLLEASVVPVPANPSALAIARALRISPETLSLVFAESGDQRQRGQRRVLTGESASPQHPNVRHKPMPSSISDRIESTQRRIVELEDRRDTILGGIDDANPSDTDLTAVQDLNRQIAQHTRHVETLRATEQARTPGRDTPEPEAPRARELVPVRPEVGVRRLDGTVKPHRVFAEPKKKDLDILDMIVRNGVITLFAHKMRKSTDDARKYCYGEDEATKIIFNMVQRAPSAPAMTDVPGWAAELSVQVQGPFMFPLLASAIFPRISALGWSLDFGRNGRINMPLRSRTTTIAGSFIGEGQPIPVRQALFNSLMITPKKLGVITVMTREIEEHSIPAIEGLLRRAIMEDTTESIDNILLDTNVATQVRPPGIRNGIAPLAPTAQASETSGFYRMVRDIRRLRAGLIGPTNDNVRSPCWMMNPIRADAIALNPAPGTGLFPFRDAIRGGTLEGWPVFESTTIDQDTIIVMDAADFITAGQGAPTFEVSDQATLHMEDTAPLPIVEGGVPATPTRSLWQTDSYALRLLYRLNWMLQRPMVAWMGPPGPPFTWGFLTDTGGPGLVSGGEA